MIAHGPTNDIQNDTTCHNEACLGKKEVGLCVSRRGYYFFLFVYAKSLGMPLHAGRRE